MVATFDQAKVVIIGHSVGAWISLQVDTTLARQSTTVDILLGSQRKTLERFSNFPNMSYHLSYSEDTKWPHIICEQSFKAILRLANTTKWLFRPPLPRLISWLTYATRPLPLSLFFSHWPTSQTAVLRSLLNSPASVYACLSMADEEMGAIRELDTALLDEYGHRLHFYFAEEDQWVGEYKYSILRSLKDGTVVHGQPGVPHAFCIGGNYPGLRVDIRLTRCLDHSEEVATQCSSWLAL